MDEFGIFNDEGMIEGDYYSRADAEAAAAKYDPDDDVHVAQLCHDHAGQEKNACSECDGE